MGDSIVLEKERLIKEIEQLKKENSELQTSLRKSISDSNQLKITITTLLTQFDIKMKVKLFNKD